MKRVVGGKTCTKCGDSFCVTRVGMDIMVEVCPDCMNTEMMEFLKPVFKSSGKPVRGWVGPRCYAAIMGNRIPSRLEVRIKYLFRCFWAWLKRKVSDV